MSLHENFHQSVPEGADAKLQLKGFVPKTVHTFLELQAIVKWLFGQTVIFDVLIWSHPIETTAQKMVA